ncbi:hypothetical protein BMS3Abin04_02559 [bacterium BMS3Abin04]|nr:hypothetical protein BMS3Abin04_02559 [bacterium BMS3Abin04]
MFILFRVSIFKFTPDEKEVELKTVNLNESEIEGIVLSEENKTEAEIVSVARNSSAPNNFLWTYVVSCFL